MPNQYNAPKNQPVLCTCPTCGKTFYRAPSLIVGRHTFCNRACVRYIPEPLIDRFMRRVLITEKCWLWTGHTNHAGYGTLGIDGGPDQFAHRLSYELHVGPIPEGMRVCHTCDNPPCVNPAHLFPGTNADNMEDKVRKGRQMRGSRQHFAKLTEETVVEIRRRYAAGGIMQKDLAAEYGVSRGTMSQLLSGQLWKHVPSR